MKRIYLLVVAAILVSGCSHCSSTKTVFNGKTKGFNPYGDGDIKIERVSHWGSRSCDFKILFGDEAQKALDDDAVKIDISDMDPSLFADSYHVD